MKYYRSVWLAVTTAAIIIVVPLHAEMRDTFRKLASGTGNNEQLDAAAAITGSRDQVIQSLLHIAQTSNGTNGFERPAKQFAIDCLGDYRAEKAVDFLISEISLVEVFPRKHAIGDSEYVWGLPCARSLIQIGRPALDGILQRVREPAKRRELAIFDFVTYEIEGEEVGLYRLQVELKKAEGIHKKQLQAMIDMYRDQKFQDPKNLTDESSPASEPHK